MMDRAFRSAALAALFLSVALPAFGQSVVLRLDPDEGQVSKYVMGMETHMNSPMIASDEPFMVGSVFSTQEVIGKEGDVVEYRMTTDSTDIRTPAMPMLQDQMPDQTGDTVTMKMDTRGRFVSLGVDMPAEAQQMANQLGGMRLELPEQAVSVGDTWDAVMETSVPGVPGGGGSIEMALTYALQEVSSAGGTQYATVAFEGPISMSGEAQGVGMDAGGTMSGTLVLDVTNGRLASSDVQMAMDISVAGMQMTVNQKMTMTLIN